MLILRVSHCLTSSQFSSVAQSCPTLCKPMDSSTPGLPVHQQLPEFTQTHVHWVGDAIQPSHPLLSPSPPTFHLSQHQGLFKWVSSLHQVAKVLEFQLQHQSFQDHPGLISFRMDWLDLLAVQGTLKSLLQHHSSKASILWCSAFFMVQISHPYMTTGENTALTRWTFIGQVMSLLFNMLSRLVITFLPRSKCLLISWLLISITLSSSYSSQSYLSLHIHLENTKLLSLTCLDVFSAEPCADSHSPSSRPRLLGRCVTCLWRLFPTNAFQVSEAIASRVLSPASMCWLWWGRCLNAPSSSVGVLTLQTLQAVHKRHLFPSLSRIIWLSFLNWNSNWMVPCCHFGLLRWLSGKEMPASAGDAGLTPGWGRSPGEGNGNPLQYSCLGNPKDRGAWQATVHGVVR